MKKYLIAEIIEGWICEMLWDGIFIVQGRMVE